jgi:F420-0:gamma-glutamyl ligase
MFETDAFVLAPQNLSLEDLAADAELLMGPRGESTAPLLIGLAYLMVKHEPVYEKLRDEVHSTFENVDEITVARFNT